MEIDEYFTTVLPRFKSTNAGTVVHVGTGGRNMSSSSNTDDIPAKVRRIFDEDDTDKWFIVYYLTENSTIIARGSFFFEGRDKEYNERCESAVNGRLGKVIIVFRGQSIGYDVNDSYSFDVRIGQPFHMTINGEIIP